MKEQYISLETAKLAKEKGFNWPVEFCYDKCEMLATYFPGGNKNYNNSAYCLNAPTQSLLQKWLRDEKKIFVSPTFIGPDTNKFQYRLDIGGSGMIGEHSGWFDTFEECLEAGLLASLNLL